MVETSDKCECQVKRVRCEEGVWSCKEFAEVEHDARNSETGFVSCNRGNGCVEKLLFA